MLHPLPHEHKHGSPLVENSRPVLWLRKTKSPRRGQTWRVLRGDFVGLLGPSGSGKTTLLRAMLGAVDVYDGEVVVDGIRASEGRPRVGYVPQLETIDWNFPVTVREVVMMGRTMEIRFFPWFRREEKELADHMMDQLGILHLAGRHIRNLSGGQQQRAFLARALVSSPSLLLLG